MQDSPTCVVLKEVDTRSWIGVKPDEWDEEKRRRRDRPVLSDRRESNGFIAWGVSPRLKMAKK